MFIIKIKNISCKKIIAFLMVAVLIIVTAFIYYLNSSTSLKKEKLVIVPKGSSISSIGNLLEKENIITNGGFVFKIATKILFASDLKAGAYKFSPNTSLLEVIEKLKQGDVESFFITIPEGLTVSEIASILNRESYLEGVVDAKNIKEGSLLPETYHYIYGENRMKIIARMQKAMEKSLDEAWKNVSDDTILKNKQELLILASIVEKETSVPEERTEIAGVFINRLKKGMRLQSDPTVIYGASNYNGDITRKHLKEKTPYNTYVIKGLPKGAICNPGKASLQAVANPKQTENFYFVASGNGGHIFSKTLKEHNRNVKKYLKFYKERHGK